MVREREALELAEHALALANITGEWSTLGVLADVLREGTISSVLVGGIRPKGLPVLNDTGRKELNRALKDYMDSPRKAGDFFDHFCVPHFAPKPARNDLFPTPRHLVRTLCDLVKVTAGDLVADYAAGTGGFLAEAKRRGARVTGIDVRPDMAWLAWVNTALQAASTPAIHATNVRNLNTKFLPFVGADVLSEKPPAVVLMHATGADEWTLVTKAMGSALKGRVALLVSDETLSGADRGLDLRKEILTGGVLRGIVTLPPNALQPFSSKVAHLVFLGGPTEIGREYPVPAHVAPNTVWMVTLQRDGYSRAVDRDLISPPDGLTELPLLQPLLNPGDGEGNLRAAQGEGPQMYSRRLCNSAGPDGLVLYPPPNMSVFEVVAGEAADGPFLWLGLRDRAGVTKWVGTTVDGLEHLGSAPGATSVSLISRRRAPNTPPGTPVTVLFDGTVIGVRVPPQELQRHYNVDLTPALHFARLNTGSGISSAQLLKKIHDDQSLVSNRLHNLLSKLALSPREVPPPVLMAEPLAGMTPMQFEVWSKVREQVLQLNGRSIPRVFDPKAVRPPGQSTIFVEQTLDLLERMGLIVRVQSGEESGFRLIAEGDFYLKK